MLLRLTELWNNKTTYLQYNHNEGNRYRKIYKMAVPIRNDFIRRWQHSNLLWRDVQIRQLDNISTPRTYGIFRPVVLLPTVISSYSVMKQSYGNSVKTRNLLMLGHLYALKKRKSVCRWWLVVFSKTQPKKGLYRLWKPRKSRSPRCCSLLGL